MSTSPFHTVTIAGATGNLGHHITEAFLNDGSYKVKILQRKPETKNEKADLLVSKGAEIVYADYSNKDDLVKALKGTDVLVSAVHDRSGANLHTIQSPLLAAAKEASVKRFIPSEFSGNYKSHHEYLTDKIKVREELKNSGLEYTFIFTGLFQEFLPWFGFDIKEKKATFYADGNTKLITTSIPDIGKYTVETLKIPEARNASIRVAGAIVSLNELLGMFEKASGSKWSVVVDKEIRQRFRNKTEPIPSALDDFKAFAVENMLLETDNDKFSFTPRPISEVVDILVKQA